MSLPNDINAALLRLRRGEAPGNADMLREISVGLEPLTDFYKEQYLLDYIAKGGSKIKFVTGRAGSGKTHFLQYLTAQETGFISVHFSARDVWIHDFREIYAEIFRQVDLADCLARCGKTVIRELGYEPAEIPEGMTFADYLSATGALDALTKREIRNQLREMFLKNSLIDNNFAVACGLLTGGALGHPMLESANRELLLSWLSGGKDFKLAALRGLGLSPSRITKYNARHMLRSLAEVCRMAGYPGLLVIVDDLDVLVRAKALDTIHYTRLKREDAYESIRALIDEIDTLRNIMFIFSFDRVLIDDESGGMKSYQALWSRIQNEIVSERFNKFTDMLDMDKLAEQSYTRETALEMSLRLADLVNRYDNGAYAIDDRKADEIFAKVRYGTVSLPRQVNNATLNGTPGENAEEGLIHGGF